MANKKVLEAYYKGKAARSKTKSHYGQVSKKTETAGKQGKKNKKKAIDETKEVAKSVGSAAKTNAVKKKTTDTKVTTKPENADRRTGSGAITPANSTGNERRKGAETARTSPMMTKPTSGKVTDYTKKQKGTAKGESAEAYNEYKTDKTKREKDNSVTVNTVKNGSLLYGIDSAVNQAAYMSKQPFEAAKYYDKNEKKANKKGMTYGEKKDFIKAWVTDPSHKDVLDSIDKYEKQRLKDSKYTYTKALDTSGDFFLKENASKYANTQTKTETNIPVYQTDKDGNIKYDKDGKPKVKKDKNGNTVYQKINSTQGNNIIDYYGGGFDENGRLQNQNASTQIGNQTAGWLRDSKFAAGAMQGLSYSDITRGLGNYSAAAAKDIQRTKASGAFNAGYMAGQAGQFMLGGTAKMTDALVRGVTKAGVTRGALNVGLRKGAADMMFEAPLNTLDALKMSTDVNGNFDKKAFFKYMALNTGLSGGMGGAIGGIGAKLTKNDVRAFANLSEKINKGLDLTDSELSQYKKIQSKLDNALKSNDRVKEDYIASGKANAVLTKEDAKEYISLLGKRNVGNITQDESEMLAAYERAIKQNDETLNTKYDYARELANENSSVSKAGAHLDNYKQLAEDAKSAEDKQKYTKLAESMERKLEEYDTQFPEAERIREAAAPSQRLMDVVLGDVVRELGLKSKFKDFEPKSADSMLSKVVMREKANSLGELNDVFRNKIEMDSFADAEKTIGKTIDKLRDAGFEVSTPTIKDKADTGYVGLHLIIKKDGVQGEIQFSTPEHWKIKEESEKIYASFRDLEQRSINGEKLSDEELEYIAKKKDESKALWDEYDKSSFYEAAETVNEKLGKSNQSQAVSPSAIHSATTSGDASSQLPSTRSSSRDVSGENRTTRPESSSTGRPSDIDNSAIESPPKKDNNIIPQKEEKGNKRVFYHAGDLGKSEWHHQQAGSKRHTGHYGTGTYFTSDPEILKREGYGNRPLHDVDATDYNLYRPNDYNQGIRVHDNLRTINRDSLDLDAFIRKTGTTEEDISTMKQTVENVGEYSTESMETLNEVANKVLSKNDIEDLKRVAKEEVERRKATTDKEYRAEAEKEFERFKKEMEDEYGLDVPETERARYIEDYIDARNKLDARSPEEEYFYELSDRLTKELEGNTGYGKSSFLDDVSGARKVVSQLAEDLGKSEKEINEAIGKAADVIKGYGKKAKEDSASTIIMKELGYEGVDVSGIKGLDNTEYGSVIYDLKNTNEPKAGTGFKDSAEYKTFRDTPSAYASDRLKEMTEAAIEYDIDVEKRIAEFNALNKEAKANKAKISHSKDPEHIAEYKASIEEAEIRQTQIARSIYQDVAAKRLGVAENGRLSTDTKWKAGDIDDVSAREVSSAADKIGGVSALANDVKKAMPKNKATKLANEEIKDYKSCLENYLQGDPDKELQNARAGALLDNIAGKLKENPNDADAISDLMKITDTLADNSTLPVNVRNSAKTLATATPKGRVGVAVNAVETLNKKYADRIDGTLSLTEDEVRKLATTEAGDELDQLYKDITYRLWDNIPASRMEKFNEIRHMFMLTNLRTHNRNMFGNMTFRAVRRFSDDLEIALQNSGFFKKRIEARGGSVERVKVSHAEIKENKKFLTDEFHAIYDSSGSVNRYMEVDRPDGVPVVKQKALNWLIQMDYKALEKEDMVTFIPAFRKSYMQYVKAKGWDINALTDVQKKQARERALFDAEYATFRDISAFSSWVTGKKHMLAQKKGKTIFGTATYRLLNMALEGVLPFVKTPVNILRRAVDYSPISLVRSLGELASKDPDTFVQGIKHLSTGLTGTQIFGLGVILANNDYISLDTKLGSHSGSKYYDQDMGYQDYSLVINIGDYHKSWTIDWLQPMEASLFMGAAFHDMAGDIMAKFKGEDDGDSSLGTDAIAALFAVTSPMLDASFMSSTKDMIETFERRASRETDEGEPDMAGALAQMIFADIPKNYVSSTIPQVFGQIANATDDYQRDTRSTLKDPILASWDSAGKQIINRIPFLRQKEIMEKVPVLNKLALNPKLDRWGDDKKTGRNVALRIFDAIANPSNVKEITENKYDRELFKIRNSLKKGSQEYKNFFYNFTGNPNYQLDFGKGRMSYDQAYKYGKEVRKEQAKLVQGMIDSPMYKKYMNDEMKAQEVKSAYYTSVYKGDQTIGDVYAAKRIAENETGEDEAYSAYKRMNNGRPAKEVAKEFADFYIKKEELYNRAHTTTQNDGYSVKALAAIMYNKDMLDVYDIHKSTAERVAKYWKDVRKQSDSRGAAITTAVNEITNFTVGSTYYLKENDAGKAKAMQSVALGMMAVDGNKNSERAYRAMGYDWNQAQSGAGLMLKYNKDGKYNFDKILDMKYELKHDYDLNDSGSVNKDEVVQYIKDKGITNPDEAACVFEILKSGNAKNPWGTIKDWLEWGTEPDDYGSGGGRGRGGRRGRGGGGGGSKAKMPSTSSGAIKGKVTNPFATSNGSSASNLDEAYRKKLKKLREQSRK